jgi:hypothetical protein
VWVKIDENLPDHPKFAGLSAGAVALWLFGACYCGRFLTDGRIPRQMAHQLAARVDPQAALLDDVPPLVRELVAAGLWEAHAHHYAVHDFLQYNPSRVQVERDRKVRSQHARQAARSRWRNGRHPRGARVPADAQLDAQPYAPSMRRASRGHMPNDAPTRPDPTRTRPVGVRRSVVPPTNGGTTDDANTAVGPLVELYRATGVAHTPRDGALIAGLVRRHGPAQVEATIRDLGAALLTAQNPLQYLAGACRRPRGHAPPRESVAQRAARYERLLEGHDDGQRAESAHEHDR